MAENPKFGKFSEISSNKLLYFVHYQNVPFFEVFLFIEFSISTHNQGMKKFLIFLNFAKMWSKSAEKSRFRQFSAIWSKIFWEFQKISKFWFRIFLSVACTSRHFMKILKNLGNFKTLFVPAAFPYDFYSSRYWDSKFNKNLLKTTKIRKMTIIFD